ncbi:sensor histidine kinase [Actinomyces wuliandei]|uniref:sensor histidine kinase n=1 Tax=Actinomyces wuliandei TaxID=2057743 RepID=UPI0013E30C88|nr:histidine kinase [Actinomyces wuliandei]
MTYDPFIIVGIALFTLAERSAGKLFPRLLTGSVVVVLLGLLTFTAEGNEEGIRSALLSGAVLMASWVLGARTRQVRQEAGARARSEERLHMAREVHDTLSQALGLIGMRAGVAAHVPALDEQRLREELRQIEETARSGTNELKTLLQRQRDNSPEATHGTDRDGTHRQSLEQRLSGVARMAEESGIAASVEVIGPVETLPEAVKATVHRVSREATANTIRHSSASSVAITVSFHDDGIQVCVSDNGIGNTSRLQEGNGITGMRERAALLSGTLTLTHRKGGGLTVIMNLPHPAGESGEAHNDIMQRPDSR